MRRCAVTNWIVIHLKTEFWIVLIRPNGLFLLPAFIWQPTLASADRLFPFNSSQFAFWNKPPFTANCTQNSAPGYFFPKTLHHLLLRFIRAGFNSYSQDYSHPFFSALMHKGRCIFSLALWWFVALNFGNLPCANCCGLSRGCLSPPKYTLKNLQCNR